ncbi:MAG: LPS-assembly protein LptD [Rhodocyclaceae bacterium]|nr:LPS-assembly protein LptD [Rhodocyclaceae bacterium]
MQPHVAAAESLPPLQVDPGLLGPMPARTVRVVPVEPAPVPMAQSRPPQPASSTEPAGTLPARRPAASAPAGGGAGAPAASQAVLPGSNRREDERSLGATGTGGSTPLPLAPLAPTGRITPLPKEGSRPSFLSGDNIRSVGDNQVTVEGAAELRQTGKTLKADRISYFQDQDEVDAEGHVRLTTDSNLISGPRMRRKMDAATGFFEQPDYVFRTDPQPGQAIAATTGYGHAERLEFDGEDRYRLKKGSYSTCSPSNPDWYTQADDLFLDYTRLVGEGRNGKVVFKGVPILYAPMLDFSLSNARKSGFLTPTLGTSSTSGLDATLPYYWNIAPNMDATLSPRVLARRGVLLGTEFRYLEPTYNGMARYDYLPQDRVYGADRSFYSFQHNQVLGRGFSTNLNVSGASDYRYFTDLGTAITTTAQTTFLRGGSLSYAAPGWGGSVGIQRYQTLQDPAALVAPPYDRLPSASLYANRPSFIAGTAFAFSGNFDDFVVSDPTNFSRPEGSRTVLYPQLSLPLVYSGISVTPKIAYHVTRYSMSRVQTPGDATSFSRNLPIFSLDSNLVLERDILWGGRNLLQTLEPRLYYVYVPYRDQSKFPVFDSGLADFNFAQIFAENIYSGSDRIADANQLTAALTSRIIDSQTGAQTMQAAIGQRYYFRNQGVTLPGETPRTSSKADILAAFTGTILPRTYVDSGWQYNAQERQTQRFTLGGRYQPEALKVANIGYRFKRDSVPGANDGLRDFDVSGQWPLYGRWYGLGRYNYSLHDRNLVEALAGVEYDGGCWVARAVAQRFATTTLTTTTALFFQLELNGFSRLGSDPGEVLRRSIGGYGRISDPRGAPLFGVE